MRRVSAASMLGREVRIYPARRSWVAYDMSPMLRSRRGVCGCGVSVVDVEDECATPLSSAERSYVLRSTCTECKQFRRHDSSPRRRARRA